MSSTNRLWKKAHSAIKRARKGLHIDNNDHFHRQILEGNAYTELPLFLKYEWGVLAWQSCVCLISHTQGSKANSKSNKSLMQKLKQECNAKTKLFWSRRGSFYHNSLVFAMFTPKANCKSNMKQESNEGGGVLNKYKNLVNLWASCNSHCFFSSRRGVLNKCTFWYRFFWRKRGGILNK